MAVVRWTLQATEDLQLIAEYIARDSQHYAQLFIIDLLSVVDRLVEFGRRQSLFGSRPDTIGSAKIG